MGQRQDVRRDDLDRVTLRGNVLGKDRRPRPGPRWRARRSMGAPVLRSRRGRVSVRDRPPELGVSARAQGWRSSSPLGARRKHKHTGESEQLGGGMSAERRAKNSTGSITRRFERPRPPLSSGRVKVETEMRVGVRDR
jgi:hypothetical protein